MACVIIQISPSSLHTHTHTFPFQNFPDVHPVHETYCESLQEAEAQLEHEESRVLRIQLELTQLKQEMERKMNEKDDEMESLRKNHQRQLDALQQSVEEETRLKNEQLKQRKLIEGQVDDLQGALDDQEKVSVTAFLSFVYTTIYLSTDIIAVRRLI